MDGSAYVRLMKAPTTLVLWLLLLGTLGCETKAPPLRTWRPADHAQPVSADPTRGPRQSGAAAP